MAHMFYGPEGRIFGEIKAELDRSRVLHPHYTPDTVRRGAITIEEGLEAAAEMIGQLVILQQKVLGATRVSSKEYSMNDLRKELIQTAAMCVKHLVALTEEEEFKHAMSTGSVGGGITAIDSVQRNQQPDWTDKPARVGDPSGDGGPPADNS